MGAPLYFAGCSDDDPPGPAAGNGGSAGSGAGSGGSSNGGGGAGGSSSGAAGGDSGASGSSGSAGDAGAAGASGEAGSSGSAGSTADAGDGEGGTLAFSLSSPAFDNNAGCGPGDDAEACDLFPNENTGLGGAENVSPELNWVNPPAGTQGFAIAFHDLSNLQGQDPFTHWVMWNIPGSVTGLPAELPAGAQPGVPAENTQQVSFRGNNAFAGSGACGNVYEFVLYALSAPTFDPTVTDDADDVQDELESSGLILDTATLRARSDAGGPGC